MAKSDLKQIKNIIFDLGGVILNIDYTLTAKSFIELGLVNFDLIYSKAKQNKTFDDFETGKLSVKQFRNELRKYLPAISDKDIDSSWNAMLLDLPPQRITVLQNLGKKYRIFLLSNTNFIHIKAFTKYINSKYGSQVFKDLFQKVYYSCEIGKRKPDSNCFNFVLKENGLKAAETLFVDDSIQHINGAKEVGMKTLHITNQPIEFLFN